MTFQRLLGAACLAGLWAAAPALANEPKIYPYASTANYCPAGLQPVTISGVICCGTPNQSVSYQSMMHHAGGSKKRVAAQSYQCPEGVKGCS